MLQTELPVANVIPPVIQPYQTQRLLSSIIATEEQVLELMKGVDISKACGHDGIGNKIIKSFCLRDRGKLLLKIGTQSC